MAKIGILIFTDKIKERKITKGKAFDSIKHFGFRKIISEIDPVHVIEYMSAATINAYDYVLVSIVSYYDAYNLLNETKNMDVQAKIIVGGAGFTNPIPFRHKIWAACFGRGEGLINDIIAGKELPNVWYNDKDPNFEGAYSIGQLKEFIDISGDINDDTPSHMKGFKEVHLGCRKKCYFCQYTWKNKLTTDKKTVGYKSGLNDCENTIAETDWSLNNPYFLTAIDGATERARRTVNRGNITNNAIRQTFHRYFETSNQKKTTLKLYCVVGYPFEKAQDLDLSELTEIIKEVDRECDNPEGRKLNIFMQSTHFVPMPFTPMEGEPVNLIDARGMLKKKMHKHVGTNISLTVTPYITSNVSAVEQAIINRAKADDDDYIKILISKKYQRMNNSEKLQVIKQLIPERLYGRVFGPIHKYIGNPYKIELVKQAYYNKLEKFYNIKVHGS